MPDIEIENTRQFSITPFCQVPSIAYHISIVKRIDNLPNTFVKFLSRFKISYFFSPRIRQRVRENSFVENEKRTLEQQIIQVPTQVPNRPAKFSSSEFILSIRKSILLLSFRAVFKSAPRSFVEKKTLYRALLFFISFFFYSTNNTIISNIHVQGTKHQHEQGSEKKDVIEFVILNKINEFAIFYFSPNVLREGLDLDGYAKKSFYKLVRSYREFFFTLFLFSSC